MFCETSENIFLKIFLVKTFAVPPDSPQVWLILSLDEGNS